jgi:hypothetical protein
MGLPGNLTLAVGGALVEGTVFYFVMRSVRRLTKPAPPPPERRPALRGELIVRRPELPAPPRKELTGG